MKPFPFLTLVMLVSTAAAWPFPKTTPVPSPTPSARQYIERARVLAAKQKEKLGNVQFRLTTAIRSMDEGQLKITTLEDETKKVAKERDDYKSYGDQQHDRFMNAEKRVAEGKAGLLRRDIIIGVMTLLIVVYLFLKFYIRVPFI